MTSLQRFGLEALGALALCGAFFGWWVMHNHAEQKIGAQACIQSTTVVKSVAVADSTADLAAQAAQLKLVVNTYDAKVASLSAGNAALAASLHNYALRSGRVSHSETAAGGDLCPIELPVRQGDSDAARQRGIALERAETKVFDDCDADHAGYQAVIDAYNGVRARALADAAKVR